MIQHAHGKDGIEDGLGSGEVLDTKWNDVDGVVAREVTDHPKLHHEELRWVNPEDVARAVSEHSPAVVAAPTADIQNHTAIERSNVWLHAFPFPVRTPFGVDVIPEAGVRSLTPW